MLFNFSAKRALVTGATKGVGREIAINLAKFGADVVAIGRNTDELQTLKQQSPTIETIAVDLTNWSATQEILQTQRIGKIDLLVNNAGIGWHKSFIEITENDLDTVFNINTKALIHITQTIVKDLLLRKSPGSIVNISSIASLISLDKRSVYSASKGAIDAFTRAIAGELGPSNIRINNVNPSLIKTDSRKLVLSNRTIVQPILDKTPLQRFSEIQQIVDVVLFLLSDNASMITGVCLPVDGGLHACQH